MLRTVIRKWRKNLAIRVPMEVARAAGLTDGEKVEIEALDGDIIVHRRAARVQARQDAEIAAVEIMTASHNHSLGNVSIRELLDDGRRDDQFS